ncbi:hypothetical protein CBR_g51934 [Chara braunii]|uniref:t-SNARE coiled-coil homology domain-containing protein n=1 Tax=Chara braunii TaxID=69332 RepID=A0A388M9I8_CHABU|nr:hypothetical protein CBR_g51934 [Chara braunii]|eukprot:GBG91132.1 hypothetical protein CBR_g51934 [Chara braunii]
MSVIDILTRVELITKKYEKYDVSAKRAEGMSSADPFIRFYSELQARLEELEQKASDVQVEKNRALVATLNAEIRRGKNEILNEIPKLEKLGGKKVKGVNPEELAARPDLVAALVSRVESVADGTIGGNKRGGKAQVARGEIKFGGATLDDVQLNPERYQQTEDSKAYRQEFEMRKQKQDEGLEIVSQGLNTLKNMAEDIHQELENQEPLVDEMHNKVDKANAEMRTTNKRLKDTVTSLRSSRNFCIDIILLAVVLGIAAYIYSAVK